MELHPFRILCLCLAALSALLAPAVQAHEAPFSYVDLELGKPRIEGTLRMHLAELAAEMGFDEPHLLLDSGVLEQQDSRINLILQEQLLLADAQGAPVPLQIVSIRVEPAGDFLQLRFVSQVSPPPALSLDIRLFPDVAGQQTLVSVYEAGDLRQQYIFNADSSPGTYFAGTTAGVLAVFGTFVPSGFEHVLIGPDHVLFVIGLILLGGTLRRLALIVTAFTLGHSLTLALAATGTLVPPAWLVEPLIALSIVVVGADNLLRKPGQRDLRHLFALLFGLIHGFGFALVLRDMGLPTGALASSLLAFNLGVELGQLAIVIPFATVLAWLRARFPPGTVRLEKAGSLAVVLAGVYWFVDRVRNLGSG